MGSNTRRGGRVTTSLLYLNDFDVFACEAVILSTTETVDGRVDVVLDATCFYPKGGGQDWDTGSISTSTDASEIIDAIQRQVDDIVEKGGVNTIRFMDQSEMQTVCRHVPDYIPANKPARVVIYRDDFGVPCGGTHVRDLKMVGQIEITKIKRKNGPIRVGYKLRDVGP